MSTEEPVGNHELSEARPRRNLVFINDTKSRSDGTDDISYQYVHPDALSDIDEDIPDESDFFGKDLLISLWKQKLNILIVVLTVYFFTLIGYLLAPVSLPQLRIMPDSCPIRAYPAELYEADENGYLMLKEPLQEGSWYPRFALPGTVFSTFDKDAGSHLDPYFLSKISVENNGVSETRICPVAKLASMGALEAGDCPVKPYNADYFPECSPLIDGPPCLGFSDQRFWVAHKALRPDGSCDYTELIPPNQVINSFEALIRLRHPGMIIDLPTTRESYYSSINTPYFVQKYHEIMEMITGVIDNDPVQDDTIQGDEQTGNSVDVFSEFAEVHEIDDDFFII